MKHTIIKDFQGFLNEEVSSAQPAQNQQVEGIFLLSSSTSSSNITAELATKLGVEKDKSYTFTIPTIGRIKQISTEGKFNGAQSPTGQGTPVKAGQDVLTINGKTINETGTITLTKADFPAGQPVQITASNNGFLCLMRLGNAFEVLIQKAGVGLNAKNWAIKLTMGGNPTEADARGFSFYYAKTGGLTPDSNGIASELAIIILNANGAGDRVPQADQFNYASLQRIQKMTPEQAVSTRAAGVAKSLLKKNMLANSAPTVNMENLTQLFSPGKLQGSGSAIRTLTAEGQAIAKKAMLDIATAIAPSEMPANWGQEAQAVFTDYSNMIKNSLAVASVPYWLDSAQRTHQYGSAGSVPGQTGSGGQTQGEGQFGT